MRPCEGKQVRNQMAPSRPNADEALPPQRRRTSRHIETLDALFAAAELDEQRGIDAARWYARRVRQALVDLAQYELADGVDAARGSVTISGSPRQFEKFVEWLERYAET